MAFHQFGHPDLHRVLWHSPRAWRPLLQDPVAHSGSPEHLWAFGNPRTEPCIRCPMTCCCLESPGVPCLCSWPSASATRGSMTWWRRAFRTTLSNRCRRVTCESGGDSHSVRRTKRQTCQMLSSSLFTLSYQERQERVHRGEIRGASVRHAQRGSRSGPAVWCCEESWPHVAPSALCWGRGPQQTACVAWRAGKRWN